MLLFKGSFTKHVLLIHNILKILWHVMRHLPMNFICDCINSGQLSKNNADMHNAAVKSRVSKAQDNYVLMILKSSERHKMRCL